MRAIVSACLLGRACRYDGGSKPCSELIELAEGFEAIPVCPEAASGLPVPRPAAEQRDGRVVLSDGTDVTEAFAAGARACAEAARDASGRLPSLAILKARSPSCGVGRIYDGSFTGKTIPGDGVFASLLKEAGVVLATEDDLGEEWLQGMLLDS